MQPANLHKKFSRLKAHHDKHLDWQPQTQHVNNKLAKNLQILSKLRYFIDLNILKQLNYVLIYPYLSYSILALGCASKTRLDCICIAHPRESTAPYFKLLTIPKLDIIYCI